MRHGNGRFFFGRAGLQVVSDCWWLYKIQADGQLYMALWNWANELTAYGK